MDTTELLELIEMGEDSHTQFKERFESIDALAAEICAFSNSNGGNIIVGVSDDGEITGLKKENIQKLNEWVSSTYSQNIDPQVNVTTQNIKYQDKIVMVISVPMGSNKFYMANGKDIWVKIGADKRRAKREEIQRSLQSSGHLYADEMPVEGTNSSDINIDLYRSFYKRRTHEKLEDHDIPLENLMSNLKSMADDKLTIAGLLVFGKKPEEKRPQFVIKAVLFPGNSPAESEYKDSRDISGIEKIQQHCLDAGLPEPIFEEYQGFQVVFRKDVYDEEYLRSLNLNERQIKAVMYVKEKGQITNKEYQEICATSNRTASRDLADLVSSGLFDQVGITGKGTVYIISYCKDAKDATKAPQRRQMV